MNSAYMTNANMTQHDEPSQEMIQTRTMNFEIRMLSETLTKITK